MTSPGAPDQLSRVDLDLLLITWRSGRDRQRVEQAQGVDAALQPRVSRGEDFWAKLPVVPALERETHHGKTF